MIKTTIEWHKTTEELPEKSGNYLIKHSIKYISMVPYSAKHKRFNAFDNFTKAKAKELEIADVCYWAEMPAFPENESEGA